MIRKLLKNGIVPVVGVVILLTLITVVINIVQPSIGGYFVRCTETLYVNLPTVFDTAGVPDTTELKERIDKARVVFEGELVGNTASNGQVKVYQYFKGGGNSTIDVASCLPLAELKGKRGIYYVSQINDRRWHIIEATSAKFYLDRAEPAVIAKIKAITGQTPFDPNIFDWLTPLLLVGAGAVLIVALKFSVFKNATWW
jgi:hypothetical protein